MNTVSESNNLEIIIHKDNITHLNFIKILNLTLMPIYIINYVLLL